MVLSGIGLLLEWQKQISGLFLNFLTVFITKFQDSKPSLKAVTDTCIYSYNIFTSNNPDFQLNTENHNRIQTATYI